MKRTLSLVLALVMLLGTIPVFAADSAVEQAAFLEEMGVLKGNTAGDLMLTAELKREDSVVMLARLLGLEAAAEAWEGAPTWTDLPDNPYYVSFLAWAQEAGYYQGHSNLRFGFGETISANDFALVLLRALGYAEVGDDSWETAFEDATELGLLEGLTVDKTGKLLRGDMAVMVYLALGTEMAEGGKTLAEVLGVEMPVVAMEVEATGAKKLTVTFNKAVEGVTFAVKKATVNVNVDNVKMADDNMSAIITTVTNLTKGEYTVTATGAAEEALVATVTVEDVKVSSIRLLSNDAPMLGYAGTAEGKKAVVNYEVLNQYGEKTSADIKWTVSTGQPQIDDNTGKITLELPASGTSYFTPGQVVFLTGVHYLSGTVFNGQVTIALPSNIDSIEFLGVYNVSKAAIGDVTAGFANDDFELLYLAKDQYGSKVTVTSSGAVFMTNNPLVASVEFSTGTRTVGGVVYQVLKVKNGSFTNNGGSVTVQGVSLSTGKSANYTFEVPAVAVLKSFSFSAPTSIVAVGETVELPFVAIDQFGNQVTKYADLKVAYETASPKTLIVTPSAGVVNLVRNADGTAKFNFVASGITTTGGYDFPVTVSTVVLGGNATNVNFSVKEAAEAKVIVGLNKVQTTMVTGQAIEIKATSINVQDQHGRTKTLDKFTGITVDATSSDASKVTTTTSGSSIILTGLAKGNSTITLTLKNGPTTITGSDYKFTASAVLLSDIATLEVKDVALMQEGTTKNIVVVGKLANGTEVKLDTASVVKQISSANTSVVTAAGITLSAVSGAETKADATTAVIVTMDAGNGPIIVTKDVTVSYKAPYAVKVEVDAEVDVTDFTDNSLLAEFTVTDQYGNEITTNKGIIVKSNAVTENSVVVQWTVTLVTPNGLTATTIAR